MELGDEQDKPRRKNLRTGLLLAALAIGVFAYTIWATIMGRIEVMTARTNCRVLKKLRSLWRACSALAMRWCRFITRYAEVSGINAGDEQAWRKTPRWTPVAGSRWSLMPTPTASMPWHFRPVQSSLRMHPGQLVRAELRSGKHGRRDDHGPGNSELWPGPGGPYFKKIECFCFSQQSLRRGETKRMPVMFVLDPGFRRT